MSISNEDWEKEQQRVDHVTIKIATSLSKLTTETDKLKSDIVNIRKGFWDDVTVNMEDAAEAVETAASIRQQAEVLSEKERTHRHTDQRVVLLEKLKNSPYFGRVDFQEDGETEIESIYLGLGSFYDEETSEFLIYDWRAPISSLYYDASLGSASFDTPNGTVSGKMKIKRQFLIRRGVIKSLFDTSVTIGDEMLKEVLGQQADPNLKNIVSTIQKEQNQIIRDDKSHLLVVQGAAGSGKTSSAMQRMAYLLYRFRETLKACQIMLFSPNAMFNSYVSTVLPELGEENMLQSTFQNFLDRRLGKQFRVEDPFGQLEYALNPRNNNDYLARMEGIRFKSSLLFLNMMDDYLTGLKQSGFLFRDIHFQGEVVISKDAIRKQFYEMDSNMSIRNRLEIIQKNLQQQLKEVEEAQKDKEWVEKEVDLLEEEVYTRVHQQLQKQKRFADNTFDDHTREYDMLASIVIKRAFRATYRFVNRLSFVDVKGIYKQFFDPEKTDSNLPKYWKLICKQTKQKIDQSILLYEDATPYLYVKESIEGFDTNRSIRHVFIDEAQDYSAFQFAFIKHLFPKSKWTVLGDINQTIHAHQLEDGLTPLLSWFETDRSKKIIFHRSYRSTKPIILFTRELLPDGQKIEPFERPGLLPALTKVTNKEELVEGLVQQIKKLQGYLSSIAIICKTKKESMEAYEQLKEKIDVTLIKNGNSSFKKRTVIIPSYLAKGIEFDSVLVYNASDQVYDREEERRLFYTVCTRAMHELHLFSLGEVSRFIKNVDPSLYEMEKPT
ncbi:UvrD-helicase domain-containing protein [Shimazuella sp. AN120528]|uniref:RNA polymerase recycling motor HelD n=1 Tax=Shimazuella soli TaxID=1892854 RepID=UPI001F0F3C55|nr:RNA polymerase recycling motor HelD [Shimazuella soli]MCH5583978.1 UvrD-helicase domain-containing protein [Shimazuella soli]